MRRWLILLLMLAGCSGEAARKPEPLPDDGCVGYRIMPDGEKKCVGR